LYYRDFTQLSPSCPDIHAVLAVLKNVDGRDIWREDALRAVAGP
jgi:hypothetical protein